jgi:peptide/nickel transport system ATP-binding protein
MIASASTPVLEVKDLGIAYKTRKSLLQVVRGVNFTVGPRETIGLVGESGCGKSTIAFGILDFLGRNGMITDGTIKFQGQELVGRSTHELRQIRGNKISMVYQDPMQALNPTLKVGRQLTEVLTTHQNISEADARDRAVAMLKRVYLPDAANMMDRYVHMLSGGQQQRVVIAMAMLNNPALLIMDEPTTALDVTVEAAVLDLVEELKAEFDTGIIFITHNLGVVARVSDRLCVMYAGEMVEKGPIEEIFSRPAHPYTRALLCCVPRLTDDLSYNQLWSIRGRVPPPAERSRANCIFAPRCDYAKHRCSEEHPQFDPISDEHQARCFYSAEVLKVPLFEYNRGERKLSDANQGAETSPDGALARLSEVKIYYEQKSRSLKSLFGLGTRRYVKAVENVSLSIQKGHTLGIVGESGCGKSTLVKGIIGLESLTAGKIELLGIDISAPVSTRDLDLIRQLQMVFQNPDSTLNPSFSVGHQIARPLRRFKTVSGNQIRNEVERLLRAVKLGAYYYDRLPRQLSGGEKQRVGIARALACRPAMLICDEPVSALDVSVQAAVLNLMNDIKETFDSTMIFIAHDLSVVRFISDRIAVMYLGQVVESGPVDRIYLPPYHPYTEALLSAVPVPDPTARRRTIRLPGDVPSALNPPQGCRFHTRCPRRRMLPADGRICELEAPPWQDTGIRGHRIFCHLPLEVLKQVTPVVNVA